MDPAHTPADLASAAGQEWLTKTLTRVVLSAFSLRCLSVTLKVHSHQGGESAPRIPWQKSKQILIIRILEKRKASAGFQEVYDSIEMVVYLFARRFAQVDNMGKAFTQGP
jgi:hypothetical protein